MLGLALAAALTTAPALQLPGQFHGDETPDECESYQRPYIKALRVKAGDDIAAACDAGRIEDVQGDWLSSLADAIEGK